MVKKRDQSAADFFCKIMGLATELTTADAHLRDEEVLAYLLMGLSANYDPFITSMTTKTNMLYLDDAFSYLVAFEAQKLQHLADLQLNHGASVNYVGHGGSSHGRGRGGRSHGGTPSRRDCHGNDHHPECQICGKLSHTAIKC
jgi:hypothetical protein